MDADELAPVALSMSNLERFREAILRLSEANFHSDPPWAQRLGIDAYLGRWRASRQPEQFLAALQASREDVRTIAEVWVANNDVVGFLWVSFIDVAGYDVTFAELNDVVLRSDRRGRGFGPLILTHAAELARERGANIIRGDTGAQNAGARRAFERAGGQPYRITYAMTLREPVIPSIAPETARTNDLSSLASP